MIRQPKTQSNSTFRRVMLAALLLPGSAGAMGQVPDAPHIDWIEWGNSAADASDFVEFDIGWSSNGPGPVTSVQFRLDGVPVISLAVENDGYHGEATLPVHGDGDSILTVALCNIDGCGEASPISLVLDGFETGQSLVAEPYAPSSDAEVQRELARIRANTEMLELAYRAPATGWSGGSARAGVGLISGLGQAALSGLVRGGADFAFLAVMNHLGFGSDDLSTQIGELQSSMDSLNTQVASLTLAIEALHDETTWQGFLNQHKDANMAVNLIYANFGHITSWIESGIEVDDFAWTNARANIADSLTVLAGAKLNVSGGIVDSRDGAIWQLMNAIPQRVASVDSYWPLVEEYRDYYRAALAIGFLGLDLIEDYFDGSGTTRVMADDGLQVSQRAVLAMYAYGVAPAVPESMDFVQLRGSVDGYASTAFDRPDDWADIQLAGPKLRNAFAQMAADYRPEHHGGLTLEAFLGRSAVPAAYLVDHAGGWNSTGWQVTQLSPGKPHLGQPPTYRLRPLTGRVRGNDWVESYEAYSCGMPCGSYHETISATHDQEIRLQIDLRKGALRSAGSYRLNDATHVITHYGAVDLSDRLNHAGRAAEFDPDAVRQAAFGTTTPD